MKLDIDIPEYDNEGTDVIWEKDSKINISYDEYSAYICANKEGLISLAKQLLYFAYNDFPDGVHVHYDDFFCDLENGSKELIIERKDDI